MTHPIVPSDSQLRDWIDKLFCPNHDTKSILIEVAQWGANAELKTCVEWMRGSETPFMPNQAADYLANARRPKSLKQYAIAELDDAVMRGDCITVSDALPIIRKALESLPNDN